VLFQRPADEVVARVLGAENVSTGTAIADDQIAIAGGEILIVAGPALQSGKRIGWSVRPEHVRLSSYGHYEATIESNNIIGDSHEILVRLGCTPLTIRAGLEHRAEAGRSRLEIDPHSIQVREIN
jgi:ABC-type Fe3+/spermidine/putrescine transport system ATPase subunit